MITAERIAHYNKIVKAKYPDFTRVKFALGCQGSVEFPAQRATDFPCPMALPNLTESGRCCGFSDLGLVGADFAQLKNLYNLGCYTEVQKALFILWLNDNPNCYKSGIVAASASPYPDVWSPTEKVLIEAGFEPIFRCKNNNHGQSKLTLWLLKLAKDEMIALPGVPTPAVPVVKARIKRAV